MIIDLTLSFGKFKFKREPNMHERFRIKDEKDRLLPHQKRASYYDQINNLMNIVYQKNAERYGEALPQLNARLADLTSQNLKNEITEDGEKELTDIYAKLYVPHYSDEILNIQNTINSTDWYCELKVLQLDGQNIENLTESQFTELYRAYEVALNPFQATTAPHI